MSTAIPAGTTARVGIEHVGLTVPDILEASQFFEQVFDAEVMFDLIPRAGIGDSRLRTEMLAACDVLDYEAVLGAPPDARIRAMRMLGLGNGPLIELFEYTAADQRSPVVPSDLGFQHVCIYVDDIDAAAARVLEAGGRLFAGPLDMFGPEEGEGNRFMYTRTPWGSTVELISYPSRMPSEEGTDILRPARRPTSGSDESAAKARRNDLIAANEAAVDDHFSNENPDNVDKAVALYTPDIVWEVPARRLVLRDKSEIEAEYRSMFSSVDNVEREELDRYATEDRVVTDEIGRFDLIADGFTNCPLPVGSKVEMRLVHIFHMRDGMIAREHAYEMWGLRGDFDNVER